MRHLVTRLLVLLVAVAIVRRRHTRNNLRRTRQRSRPRTKEARSPWLLVPVFSSSPKLGTALGGLGAYMHVFDPESRVSLFGVTYQYTSTHSQIFSAFARTSSGADHHRIVLIAAFGHIKNDYDDYLGTGQPLKTDDDLKAFAGRYLFRAKGDWFIGAPGECRQLPGAGSDRRKTISCSRHWACAASSRPALGAVADARFTRQRRHAHDRLVLECQQPGLS